MSALINIAAPFSQVILQAEADECLRQANNQIDSFVLLFSRNLTQTEYKPTIKSVNKMKASCIFQHRLKLATTAIYRPHFRFWLSPQRINSVSQRSRAMQSEITSLNPLP